MSEWGLVVICWHASQQWKWADCMLVSMIGFTEELSMKECSGPWDSRPRQSLKFVYII
jgi:hypothetical protein